MDAYIRIRPSGSKELSFIMTLDTFSTFLEDNYVQLNRDVEMYGYTNRSMNQNCPRCVSNSKMLPSDLIHSDDCMYFLNTFSSSIVGDNHSTDNISAVTIMYDTTCNYLLSNPLVDKIPPLLQKPLFSRIQESLYMLLPFRNSLTDAHEIFYQWCTMQETIEVCNESWQSI